MVKYSIFIRPAQIEKATEASLGYFIFHLMVVCIDWIGFVEHLSRLQNSTIALVAILVVLMTSALACSAM